MTCYRRLFDLEPASSVLDNKNSAAATYRVSEDGLLYTFILKEGQSFPDGTLLDSYAALYSFDRLMSTQTGSIYFPRLKFFEIVGPHTFRFRLDSPWPPFLASLTSPMASLISPSLSARPSGYLDQHSLGSGGFEVDSVEPTLIKLKIRSDAQVIPKLDRIEFYYNEDPQKRYALFIENQAHLAWQPQYTSPLDNRFELIKVTSFETKFLAFNLLRPYLKMDGARELITDLAASALSLSGERVKPVGFFPAGLAPSLPVGAPPSAAELEKRAVQLLSTLGPSRIPLDLVYQADDPSGRSDAEVLASKLSAHGLAVRLVPLSGAHGQGILEKGDWDMLLDFRRPEYPSPEMWLGGFLDSRATIKSNPARFNDSQVDQLIEGLSTQNNMTRESLLRRLNVYALEKRPYVMLYQKTFDMLIDKRLSNIRPHPMWPQVWPIEQINLDPFKAQPKVKAPEAPSVPLIQSFDHPVAEPYE
jgi:peptide/nickel transport system substrate-binding protein